jgi:predicted metal-binding protein
MHNNMQASSILSLFATNNEQRQSFVAQIIDSIKNGKLSALNVHLQLKCMGIISEMITTDKAFKEAIQKDGVVSVESEVIKVTNCEECPMLIESNTYEMYDYDCKKGAFRYEKSIPDDIHPNCPFKNNDTVTYKFVKDEPRD